MQFISDPGRVLGDGPDESTHWKNLGDTNLLNTPSVCPF